MGEDQSVNGIESPGRNGQPVLLTRIEDMRAVQPQCLLPSEWVLHGEHVRQSVRSAGIVMAPDLVQRT